MLRSLIYTVIISFLFFACSSEKQDKTTPPITSSAQITFVELGSVNCIPCKQMQPVMASIEDKFAEQVNVVFYDVWQADQKHFAAEYGIKLIPTQVFLDSSGVELMRHEGFFPESDIEAFLVKQGLTVRDQNS